MKHIGYIYVYQDADNKICHCLVDSPDSNIKVFVRTNQGIQEYNGLAARFWSWCQSYDIKVITRAIECVDINDFLTSSEPLRLS